MGSRDRVAMGVECGAQGLFFTAGGRRDHIKFFYYRPTENENYISLSLVWLLVFSFFFYKTAAGKKNAGGR